ncbi:MAG: hypothetical protein ACRCZ9_08960 [Fusobacteriaceae bacterium]
MSNPNSDILLLNTFYDKEMDRFYYVYRNTKTGVKGYKFIDKPKIPIYKLKSEYPTPEYFKEYELATKLDKFDVSYKWRIFDLARINKYDSFTQDLKNKRVKPHDIFLDKTLYGADIDLRDWFIMGYMDSMGHTDENGKMVYPDQIPIRNIHRGYFDIETDIKVSPNREEQPIYMISYVDNVSNTCYVWNLINPEYNKQDWVMKNEEQFIQGVSDNLFTELSKSHPDKGSKEYKTFFKIISSMKYKLLWYTDEKKLLLDTYQFMFRHAKPDYLYAFNASYDVSQTEMRANVLGIKPEELWCDPNMGSNYVNMNYRDATFKPSKRRHNFECASTTKILDMMITYYAIRSQKDYPTYNLDDTAQRETKFKKVSYGHICNHISELPYSDFAYCLEYNIRDTLLLYMIDEITDDTTSLLTKKYIARTEFDRMFVPMSAVSNVWFHMCRREGQILSNEINKYLHKIEVEVVDYLKNADEDLYEIIMSLFAGGDVSGGLCTEPNKFVGEGLNIIPGMKNSKVLGDTGDEDAASMYPNNIITGNITKSTLVGKIVDIDKGGVDNDTVIDFTLSLVNRDAISIGSHFGLPNAEQLYGMVLNKTPNTHKTADVRNTIIDFNTAEKIKLYNLLSTLDKNKLNSKDKESGDYQSSRSFVVNRNGYSQIRVLSTCVSYKLKYNNLFDYLNIPEDMDFAYITGRKTLTDNENYTTHVKPKRTLDVSSLVLLHRGSIEKDVIRKVANELHLSHRIYTGYNGVYIDAHARLIPILDTNSDFQIEVYKDPVAHWLYFVRLKHSVEVLINKIPDVLEIVQDIRVIDYQTV